METIVPVSTSNEDERKLFVGGLPQEAKDTDVKEYFGQFGEIESVTLKTDPNTGRSRGFAFVLYKEPASLDAASASEAHVVKGKKVTCKKAESKQGKIYIGKLATEGLTKEDIESYFSQYGTVAEVVRPVDKTNNETPKNFAFVTFEKEEVAKHLIKLGTVTLNGQEVEVKKVTNKDNRGGFGGRGGRGGMGYGGGWGGYGADPYGMFGGYGGYGADPYGAFGGYGGYQGFGAGGKVRGRGRGRGRSKPY